MRSRLIFLSAALLAAVAGTVAQAALPETAAASKTAAFVRAKQEADGGFGGFGPGQTWDAVFALRAAGYDPNVSAASGKTAVDFLKANAAAQTKPAAAAKAALAAKALGLDPKSVAGVDFLDTVSRGISPAGRYADDEFSQAVAILGLACNGSSVPASAISALKGAQLADGGWGFGGASDPDTTAIALQALVASGLAKDDAGVARAVARLRASQGSDGGWGFDPTASNASSTAYVVQALLAAGEQPESVTYTKSGKTPVAFLLGLQNADGSFPGFDSTYAAIQALPALAGRTFCNAPDTPTTRRFPALPAPTPTPSPLPAATPSLPPLPPATGSGRAAGRTDLATLVAIVFLVAGGAGSVAVRSRTRTERRT